MTAGRFRPSRARPVSPVATLAAIALCVFVVALVVDVLSGCGGPAFSGDFDPDGTNWRPGDVAPPPALPDADVPAEASVPPEAGPSPDPGDAQVDGAQGPDASVRDLAPDASSGPPDAGAPAPEAASPTPPADAGSACAPPEAGTVLPYWPSECGSTAFREPQQVPAYFSIVQPSGCMYAMTPPACLVCASDYSCACILSNYLYAAGWDCTCDDSTGMPALLCQ